MHTVLLFALSLCRTQLLGFLRGISVGLRWASNKGWKTEKKKALLNIFFMSDRD